MTETDHPAATITADQLGKLKAAFEQVTKDQLVVDGISYIDKSVSPPNPAPAYADVWTADPINGRRLCKLPYADACFFALAHNLMPSLIAAAEEAERLRATEKVAIVDGFFTHETLRRERGAAFAAGRKEGLEDAVAIARISSDSAIEYAARYPDKAREIRERASGARTVADAIMKAIEIEYSKEPANV